MQLSRNTTLFRNIDGPEVVLKCLARPELPYNETQLLWLLEVDVFFMNLDMEIGFCGSENSDFDVKRAKLHFPQVGSMMIRATKVVFRLADGDRHLFGLGTLGAKRTKHHESGSKRATDMVVQLQGLFESREKDLKERVTALET